VPLPSLGPLCRKTLAVFRHFLWPAVCPCCGALGELACPSCLDALATHLGPRCSACGGAYPCFPHSAPPLWGPVPYGGPARELVHRLKFRRERALGALMGSSLGRCLPPPEGAALLVPVPLHRGSSRGYNQSEEIARGLGREWSLPVVDALQWTRDWDPQSRRVKASRRDLPLEALRWEGPPRGGVVLVDDVCTTGTTLDRCSRAARRGRSSVVAWVAWSLSEGGIAHATRGLPGEEI